MSWESQYGSQYRNEYKKEHYDRYSLMLPKGKKVEYMALADKKDMTLNELINKLLELELNKED